LSKWVVQRKKLPCKKFARVTIQWSGVIFLVEKNSAQKGPRGENLAVQKISGKYLQNLGGEI